MMEMGYCGKEEFVRSRLANDISRSEHLLFYPVMLNPEREKQVYTALTLVRKDQKFPDNDVSEELVARTAARLSGIQIGQEYWEDAIEKAILKDPELCERYLENYEGVEAAAIKPMGGLSYVQKQPFVYRLYPPAEREISSRGKRLGLALLGIIAGGIGIPIAVNYFTGFLKSRWLPINPNGNFDGDELKNKDDPDPFEPNPAVSYAHKHGLPIDEAKLFEPFEKDGILDENEKLVIDYISQLPKESQNKFASFILSDGKIDVRELGQIKFLESLDRETHKQAVESEKIYDFDWDKDNMNNCFEKFIAGLPYDVKNDRYALLIDTFKNSSGADTMYKFLVNEQKFSPKKIIKLIYTDATIENFKKSVSYLSGEVDENDLIYIIFESHGGEGTIAFNDGYGNNKGKSVMSYEDIDGLLDSINPSPKATVITIKACKDATALEPLKEGSTPRVVMTMPPDWFFAVSKSYKNRYTESLPKQYDPIEPENYDIDGNGYVSVNESYETQMKSMQRFLIEHPEIAEAYGMIDLNNISKKLYFGDFRIDSND